MSTTLTPFFGVMPPEGGEAVSWVIDLNGRRPERQDAAYPPAARWTRFAMGRSRMRSEDVLKRIEKYLWNRQTPIREITGTEGWSHDQDPDVARILLIKATLTEVGSPLVIVTIYPTGVAEFWTWRARGANNDCRFTYLFNDVTGTWDPAPTVKAAPHA